MSCDIGGCPFIRRAEDFARQCLNVRDIRLAIERKDESINRTHEGARLRAQYEEKIAQAQSAAYAAKDAILQEARQQREKILGQARAEAASKLEQARREIALALEKEKALAAAETTTVAGEMVSKVLGRKVA